MEEQPAAAEEERVLRDYLAYYAARGAEGRLAACDEAALKARARRLLEPRRRGGLDVRGVAERCRRARGQRGSGCGVLKDLLKALEVLELLCVNLLLSPWRKEIRSLKVGGPRGRRGEALPGPALPGGLWGLPGSPAHGGAGEGEGLELAGLASPRTGGFSAPPRSVSAAGAGKERPSDEDS